VAWWWWVLIWVVLLGVSAGVLFLLGRSLWRKLTALGRELATATDRLSAVSDGLNQLAERSSAESSSVFTDPAQLRQERFLAGRRRDGKHSAKPANQLRVGSTRRANQRVR
jgi:hypothetical protein